MSINIVMIAGAKRSGKDTLAKIIKERIPNSDIKSFAYPMKKMLSNAFNISIEDLDYLKDSGALVTTSCSRVQTSMRAILQNFGTEGAKPIFGSDVWAKLMLDNLKNNRILIIPDFRFIEEFEVLKETGHNIITVKVINKDLLSNDGHSSENGLSDFRFDYQLVNKGANLTGISNMEILAEVINSRLV